MSIRQTVTASQLLGRMNASDRTVVWGAIPVGALVGGVLGELVGLRSTIAVAAVGLLLVPLRVIRYPVPALRDPPEPDGAALGLVA